MIIFLSKPKCLLLQCCDNIGHRGTTLWQLFEVKFEVLRWFLAILSITTLLKKVVRVTKIDFFMKQGYANIFTHPISEMCIGLYICVNMAQQPNVIKGRGRNVFSKRKLHQYIAHVSFPSCQILIEKQTNRGFDYYANISLSTKTNWIVPSK